MVSILGAFAAVGANQHNSGTSSEVFSRYCLDWESLGKLTCKEL